MIGIAPVERVVKEPHPIELDANQASKVLGRPAPATTIVVINVEPTMSGPIGCLACVEHSKACKEAGTVCKCTGTKVPDAWRFPIRAIEGTDLLRPDQIARRMNVNERRALLELQAIEGETKIQFWFDARDGKRGVPRPCKITKLDPHLMVCTIELQYSPGSAKPYLAEIPLVFVRAVWQSSAGWNVSIEGIAFEQKAGDPTQRENFMPPGGIL